MSEEKFILLAVPKNQKDDTHSVLQRKCVDQGLTENVHKFPVPDFTVGTLDSLLSLSDELKKIDNYGESVVKRIAQALQDAVSEERTEEEEEEKKSNKRSGRKKEKEDTLLNIQVDSGSYPIPKYLAIFKWLDARYQKRTLLKGLTAAIHSALGIADNDLKTKATNYSNTQHSISTEIRKTGGNLSVKDFSDFVNEKMVVSSEYLESIFVAVPKYNVKEFIGPQGYETWLKEVVPRSALQVTEDNDFTLFRVVVLSKKANDFKNTCREKKIIVREFKYVPNSNSASNLKKLELERTDARKKLITWGRVNLSEAFLQWIHLKCIRVFVESVLRFGLPTNFQAVVIQPKKGKEYKLREFLNSHYAYLGNKSVFAKHDQGVSDEVAVPMDDEDMYPYVSVDINIDWKKTW